MEIIGHRGAKGLAPENSIEAVRKAIKYNVDMIEVDARMQGSTVVLSHDATKKAEPYCTLRHALNEIEGKIPLNIEVKEMKVIKHLPKLLENYKGKIVFSSFSYNVLKQIKKTFPETDIAVIEKWSGIRAVTFATLLDTKQLHMNQKWLWHGFVASLKNQGFTLYAYTVNDSDRAKELEKWGVNGIFTDFPNRF